MDFKRRVGARVKQRRRAAGLSQTALARQLPGMIESGAISRWERGRQFPTLANISALAKVFGCTEEELLACDVEPEKRKRRRGGETAALGAAIAVALTAVPGTVFGYPDDGIGDRGGGAWLSGGRRLVSAPISRRPEVDRAQSAEWVYSLTGI